MQTSLQTFPSIEPSSIDALSDRDFITLSKTFSALPSIEEKVAFILSHSKTGEGIINPLIRLIDGTVYSYGFELDWFEDGEPLVLTLHKQLLDQIVERDRKDLHSRLQLCRYNREVVNLLEAELLEYKSRLIKPNYSKYESAEFHLGYQFEVRKKNDVYHCPNVDLQEELDSNEAFYQKVRRCALGAATYRMEMHVEELWEGAKRNAIDPLAFERFDTSEPSPMSTANKSKEGALPPLQKCQLDDFIEPALCEKFISIEQEINAHRSAWLQGEEKIDCAGFMQALFQRHYFTVTASSKRSTVNNELVRRFALWRYGLDLKGQLSPQKRKERDERCKDFLNRSIW